MRALHYKILRGYFNLLDISRWKTKGAIFKGFLSGKRKHSFEIEGQVTDCGNGEEEQRLTHNVQSSHLGRYFLTR